MVEIGDSLLLNNYLDIVFSIMFKLIYFYSSYVLTIIALPSSIPFSSRVLNLLITFPLTVKYVL